MPFEKGNQLGKIKSNPHEFANAVRVAVKDTQGDKTKLRHIAEKVVNMAVDGDLQAIKEVADRLDGKPKQTVDANVNDARLSQAELDSRIIELFGLLSQGAIARASGDEVRTNGKPKPH